jgi:hypothetical protein
LIAETGRAGQAHPGVEDGIAGLEALARVGADRRPLQRLVVLVALGLQRLEDDVRAAGAVDRRDQARAVDRRGRRRAALLAVDERVVAGMLAGAGIADRLALDDRRGDRGGRLLDGRLGRRVALGGGSVGGRSLGGRDLGRGRLGLRRGRGRLVEHRRGGRGGGLLDRGLGGGLGLGSLGGRLGLRRGQWRLAGRGARGVLDLLLELLGPRRAAELVEAGEEDVAVALRRVQPPALGALRASAAAATAAGRSRRVGGVADDDRAGAGRGLGDDARALARRGRLDGGLGLGLLGLLGGGKLARRGRVGDRHVGAGSRLVARGLGDGDGLDGRGGGLGGRHVRGGVGVLGRCGRLGRPRGRGVLGDRLGLAPSVAVGDRRLRGALALASSRSSTAAGDSVPVSPDRGASSRVVRSVSAEFSVMGRRPFGDHPE